VGRLSEYRKWPVISGYSDRRIASAVRARHRDDVALLPVRLAVVVAVVLFIVVVRTLFILIRRLVTVGITIDDAGELNDIRVVVRIVGRIGEVATEMAVVVLAGMKPAVTVQACPSSASRRSNCPTPA
jgi:hypothetical protein